MRKWDIVKRILRLKFVRFDDTSARFWKLRINVAESIQNWNVIWGNACGYTYNNIKVLIFYFGIVILQITHLTEASLYV